jgi:hypothetical protein
MPSYTRDTMLYHSIMYERQSHPICYDLPGEYNPVNILSKHWAYASVWQTMNALLFARGDTWDLLDDECGEE